MRPVYPHDNLGDEDGNFGLYRSWPSVWERCPTQAFWKRRFRCSLTIVPPTGERMPAIGLQKEVYELYARAMFPVGQAFVPQEHWADIESSMEATNVPSSGPNGLAKAPPGSLNCL